MSVSELDNQLHRVSGIHTLRLLGPDEFAEERCLQYYLKGSILLEFTTLGTS